MKGGDNVNVAMLRDIAHVVDREKAKIGIFIILAGSTGPMRTEEVKAGYYESLYGKYPKIRILTTEDLFAGKQLNVPLVDTASFKKASRKTPMKISISRFEPRGHADGRPPPHPAAILNEEVL